MKPKKFFGANYLRRFVKSRIINIKEPYHDQLNSKLMFVSLTFAQQSCSWPTMKRTRNQNWTQSTEARKLLDEWLPDFMNEAYLCTSITISTSHSFLSFGRFQPLISALNSQIDSQSASIMSFTVGFEHVLSTERCLDHWALKVSQIWIISERSCAASLGVPRI